MDKDELSEAKSTSRQDDILAVCKLHGFIGNPSIEHQLQALDKEFQQLRDQGQSSKADYVQTLYIWLFKKTAKVTVSYCRLLLCFLTTKFTLLALIRSTNTENVNIKRDVF